MSITKRIFGLNPIAEGLSDNPLYQPQLTNHFEMYIYLPSSLVQGDEKKILDARKYITLAVKSVDAPDLAVNTLEIPHGNTKVNIAGQVNSKQTGTMVVNDYIGANTKEILFNWMSLVNNPYTGQMGWAANYKCKAQCIKYSPDGALLDGWVYTGFFPTSVGEDNMSKDGSNINTITVQYAYDLALPLRVTVNNRNQYEKAVAESAEQMVPMVGQEFATENMGGPLNAYYPENN